MVNLRQSLKLKLRERIVLHNVYYEIGYKWLYKVKQVRYESNNTFICLHRYWYICPIALLVPEFSTQVVCLLSQPLAHFFNISKAFSLTMVVFSGPNRWNSGLSGGCSRSPHFSMSLVCWVARWVVWTPTAHTLRWTPYCILLATPSIVILFLGQTISSTRFTVASVEISTERLDRVEIESSSYLHLIVLERIFVRSYEQLVVHSSSTVSILSIETSHWTCPCASVAPRLRLDT